MKIRPIKDWIHIVKCFKEHIKNESGEVVIYRTESDVDTTNFARIVSCGPDCDVFNSFVGRVILCPEIDNDMKGIGEDQLFIRERYFKKNGVCAVF